MPEREIPLFVSPRNGELLGCGETNCGLWGQGVIFESDSSAARLALTMAGCEVCDRVSISSSDLGIVPVDTKKWGVS